MSAAMQVFEFEGARVAVYLYRGRPCWVAQEVGAALGYEPGGWRAAFGKWVEADELDADDFAVLRGAELREFKALLDVSVQQTLSRAANLTILFESGVDGVCLLTEKPLGKALRRFLRKEVMPKLRRGALEPSVAEQELVALSLRLLPAEATTIWEVETVQDLCRVHRMPVWSPPERMPVWLKGPMGRIYRIVLGDTVYSELKKRNPDPRDGSLNYQFLSEARHRLMQKDMGMVSAVLRMSGTSREFFARLRFACRRAPLQLAWGA